MSIVEIARPLAWTAAIHLAAWGAGGVIERRILGRTAHGPDATRVFLAMVLGFGVLANIALILGLLRALHPIVVICLVVALALVGLRDLMGKRLRPRLRPRLDELPLLAAFGFVLWHLPAALHPWLGHDDLVYHLVLPKLYLGHRAIISQPVSLAANMPHLVEVLYTLPLAIGDFIAVKVFAYSTTFWTLAGLAGLVRSRLGSLGAGVVAMLFVSGHNVVWHWSTAYNEPVIALFLLGAVAAFAAWQTTGNNRYPWVAGACAGFACASKYTALLYSSVLFAILIFAALRHSRQRQTRLSAVLVGAAICCAIASPWLIKNAILTGNPIYPSFFGVLGGANWSEVQEMHLMRSILQARGLPERDLLGFLSLPFRLVVSPLLFHSAAFSASLLALWVYGLFKLRTWRGLGGSLQVMSLAGFFAWSLGSQEGRYLMAWLPVMTFAASMALDAGRGLLVVAALTLGSAVAQHQLQTIPPPHLSAADIWKVPRKELVARDVCYDLCDYLNQVVPVDGKVLGLWENRLFFLDRAFEADPLYEAPSFLARLRALDDVDAFARELRSRGFTHAVLNPKPFRSYVERTLPFDLLDEHIYPLDQFQRDKALFTDFMNHHLEALPYDGADLVFKLRTP